MFYHSVAPEISSDYWDYMHEGQGLTSMTHLYLSILQMTNLGLRGFERLNDMPGSQRGGWVGRWVHLGKRLERGGKSPCTWYWAGLHPYSLLKKCRSAWWLDMLQVESVEPWLCLPAPAPKAATCFRCQLTDAFYLLSSSQQGQSPWAWFSSWPRWPQCASLEELRLAFQSKQTPSK